jgi:hypothetical protein
MIMATKLTQSTELQEFGLEVHQVCTRLRDWCLGAVDAGAMGGSVGE